jgi:phosphoenolpyruvate---glycerone phosphotransferase subunit DhaL
VTGSGASQEVSVAQLIGWFERFAREIEIHAEELSTLDGAIGDADHGTNLNRGCRSAVLALRTDRPQTVAGFARTIGMQLISSVGGASGVLYGSFFLAFGVSAGDAATLTPQALAAAWEAGVTGVISRGKADVGDKTMVDVLVPTRDALTSAVDDGAGLKEVLKAALAAADHGLESALPLVARKGRASYVGERSTGHQDPGAQSSWFLVRAASSTLAG